MSTLAKSKILLKLKKMKHQLLDDGVEIVGVFGSFARNEETPDSDVDISYKLLKEVFFKKYKGFEAVSKIAEIKDDLSKKLNRKVDLISFENSNQDLVNNIKKDIVYV
jgi:predicted nucleotidyltransferase